MAARRDLTARLLLVFKDGATAGLMALQRRLEGLTALARRIGAIGAIGGGLAFASIVPQAAAFDDTMRQMAITAGLSGTAVEEMTQRLRGSFERLALEAGQRSRAVSDAASQLFAAGLPEDIVERMLPRVSRAATATGASLRELTETAIALNQNLRIGPDDMSNALASLAQAGKDGRFELKDMARSFATLTASAQALKIEGRAGAASLAAMLQVARRGAGTADQAANNFDNFLSKLSAPETVRNFRNFGVDIERVMANARLKGINPVEAALEKIRRLTGGNEFKLGQLFGDQETLKFLRPMLSPEGRREYARIMRSSLGIDSSLIDTDFASRIRGQFMQLEGASERVEQIGRRFADGISANLPALNDLLGVVQSVFATVDKHFPGAIDFTVKWATALVGLVAAFGLVGTLVAILNPIGAAIGVVAAGVLLIATNWDKVKAVWGRASADLADSFGQIRDRLRGIWTDAGAAFRRFVAPIARRLAEMAEAVSIATDRIGSAFADLWTAARGGFDDFVAWVRRGLRPIEELLATLTRAWERLRRPAEPGSGGVEAPPPNAPSPAQRQRQENWRDRGLIYPRAPAIELQSAPGNRASREWSGRIEISLQPGLQLRRAEVQRAAVTFTSGNSRGVMLRPA